jgi:hypothetical protein
MLRTGRCGGAALGLERDSHTPGRIRVFIGGMRMLFRLTHERWLRQMQMPLSAISTGKPSRKSSGSMLRLANGQRLLESRNDAGPEVQQGSSPGRNVYLGIPIEAHGA